GCGGPITSRRAFAVAFYQGGHESPAFERAVDRGPQPRGARRPGEGPAAQAAHQGMAAARGRPGRRRPRGGRQRQGRGGWKGGGDEGGDDTEEEDPDDKEQPPVTAGGLYTMKTYPVRENSRPLTLTQGIVQLRAAIGADLSAKGAFQTFGVNLEAIYGLRDN